MKQFVILFASLLLPALLFAQSQTEVTVSEKTATLPVEISGKNVKLSKADYTVPVVKVLIPGLADVTILDHRNTNEGAPCLATYETEKPEDVIAGKEEVISVPLQIKLLRRSYREFDQSFLPKEGNDQICTVYLVEKIDGQIRGFNFTHERSVSVGRRHLDDCR